MWALLAGLGLFLAGIRLSGEHLQGAFGPQLRYLLARVRGAPLRAAAAGGLITALTQSATLVTVLTVQFSALSILGFRAALAAMLGSTLGGTLLVQLLSLHVQLAFPLLTASLLLRSRRLLGGHLGGILLGLGTLLLGQQLLLEAVQPLTQQALPHAVIAALAASPLALFLLGVALTVLMQSSNATTLLVLSLASVPTLTAGAGALPAGIPLLGLPQGVEVIVGANVGSAVSALLSSVRGGPLGWRVAVSHLAVKLLSAALLLPLAPQALTLLGRLGPLPARQLADAHTLFNLVALVVFLPLTGVLERLFTRLLPPPPSRGGPVYLDPVYLISGALPSPDLAYGLAFRETVRVAEEVYRLFQLACGALGGQDVREAVAIQEHAIDALVHEVVLYLIQLSPQVEGPRLSALVDTVSELEALADLCKRLSRQPEKLRARGQRLQPQSERELQRLAADLDVLILRTVTGLSLRRPLQDAVPDGCAPAALPTAAAPDGAAPAAATRREDAPPLSALQRLALEQEHRVSIGMLLDVLAILRQLESGFRRIGRSAAQL